MIKAAVLGSPISHSLSPKIHSKAYEILGLENSYSAIEIDELTFPDFFNKIQSHGGASDWTGFSLTMPLKEIVLNYCKSANEVTTAINSGNTLYKNNDSWFVISSDYLAFQNLISVSKDSKIAIIGGGGTARAAIGSLNLKAKEVDVFLRSDKRMPDLIKAAPNLNVNILEMSSDLGKYDLIIQTTPSGVFDQYASLLKKADGVLLEALYKPWPTKLTQSYQDLGGKVISGKQLLVEQALYQIEIFSGVEFNFDEMRPKLLSHISED